MVDGALKPGAYMVGGAVSDSATTSGSGNDRLLQEFVGVADWDG